MQRKSKIANNHAITFLVCVIIATALWFYVSYVENPAMSKWIKNIPITVTGEARLNEKGFAVSEASHSTVSIKLRAKRNDFKNLTAENIIATADISTINKTGENTISVKFTYPHASGAIEELSKKNDTVTFTVETYETKLFTVEPIYSQKPGNSCMVYDYYFENNEKTVSVSGGASQLNKVKRVVTNELDMANVTADTVRSVTLTAYDENNTVVEGVTLSSSKEEMTFVIYKSKIITPTFSYYGDDPNLVSSFTTPTVHLIGPPDEIDSIESITVRLNEYNHRHGDKALMTLSLPPNVKIEGQDTNEVEVMFSNTTTTAE